MIKKNVCSQRASVNLFPHDERKYQVEDRTPNLELLRHLTHTLVLDDDDLSKNTFLAMPDYGADSDIMFRLECSLTTSRRKTAGLVKVLSTFENIVEIFTRDPKVRGLFRYNKRFDDVYIFPNKYFDVETARKATDADLLKMKSYVSKRYGIAQCSLSTAFEVMLHVAQSNAYDCFEDYLKSLKWDGVRRIKSLFSHYCPAADPHGLNSTISIRWMISAVARAMNWGSQVDTMLILEGDQGIGKSTFFRALASDDYFTDAISDMKSKDAMQELIGPMFIEISELDAMKRSEISTVKAFLTKRFDRFRAPYGKIVENHARRCIFVGTVNPDGNGYLNDVTGSRRFIPIKCTGKIKVDEIAADRDQLWAEAYQCYLSGEQWHMTDEETKYLVQEQQERQADDDWSVVVSDYIEAFKPTELTTKMLLTQIIDIPIDRHERRHQMRMGDVLRSLGWTRFKRKEGSRVITAYRKET